MSGERKARIVRRDGMRPVLQVFKTPADVSVDAAAIVAASDRLAESITSAARLLAAALDASAKSSASAQAIAHAIDAFAAVVRSKESTITVAPAAVTVSPQIVAQAGESRVQIENRVTADVQLPKPRKRVARIVDRGQSTEIEIE